MAYPQIQELTKQYENSPYSLQRETSDLAMGRLPCHPIISGTCDYFQKQIIPSIFLMNQVFTMSQSIQRINNYIDKQQIAKPGIEEEKITMVTLLVTMLIFSHLMVSTRYLLVILQNLLVI